MKTKRIVLAGFVAIALAIGVTSAVLIKINNKPPQPATQQQDSRTAVSERQTEVVRFTAEPNKSVLEQLASQAAIETKNAEFGTYVDVINGIKGGENGKYWTYYVDGQMAQIGADAYITEGGEVIEWKFE